MLIGSLMTIYQQKSYILTVKRPIASHLLKTLMVRRLYSTIAYCDAVRNRWIMADFKLPL